MDLQSKRQLESLPPRMQSTLLAFEAQCQRLMRGGTLARMDGVEIPADMSFRSAISAQPNGGYVSFEEPSAVMRRTARNMARQMEAVYIGGDVRARIPDRHGPGKIRTQVLMQNYADLKQRKMPPSDRKLYRRTKVTHMPRTPIKLGVVLDTSFSMASMAELGMNMAWTIGEATRSVNGKVAVTTFGFDAWGLVAPGERTKFVPRVSMVGGPHKAAWAFEMADAALDLTDGDGARVLVMFTDADFNTREVMGYIAEAIRQGVIVVMVTENEADGQEAFATANILGMHVIPRSSLGVAWNEPDKELEVLCTRIGESIVEAATQARKGVA